MTNLLRLLLLLLMGSSLLAARWADGLGQPAPPVTTAARQVRQPQPTQAWLPYASWVGWVRPATAIAPATANQRVPVTHSL